METERQDKVDPAHQRSAKNQKGTSAVYLTAASLSSQLTLPLKGGSCSLFSNRARWRADAAETWEIAALTKTLKYLAQPKRLSDRTTAG